MLKPLSQWIQHLHCFNVSLTVETVIWQLQLLKEIRSKINISTVEAAGRPLPATTAAETGIHGHADTEFPRVDNTALDQMFYSTDTTELPFWEEVYTNMDIYAEYDLTQ